MISSHKYFVEVQYRNLHTITTVHLTSINHPTYVCHFKRIFQFSFLHYHVYPFPHITCHIQSLMLPLTKFGRVRASFFSSPISHFTLSSLHSASCASRYLIVVLVRRLLSLPTAAMPLFWTQASITLQLYQLTYIRVSLSIKTSPKAWMICTATFGQ